MPFDTCAPLGLALAFLYVTAPRATTSGDIGRPGHAVIQPERASPAVVLSTLSDVAEIEPNNFLAIAQPLGCGNTVRPATLTSNDLDFYSFAASAGDIVTIGTDADGSTPVGDTVLHLYDSQGNLIAFDDDSGPGFYSLISGYVIPQTGTYYAEVSAFSGAETGGYLAYIICQSAQPPPNDQCAGAISIGCGPIHLGGDTQLATNDYSPSGACTGFQEQGRDVAYVMHVFAGDTLTLVYQSTADAALYLVTDCADVAGTCVFGRDSAGTGGAESLRYRFTASGTYYLILDSFGVNTSGNWTAYGSLSCPTLDVAQVSSPSRLALRSIAPNPFSGASVITFSVPFRSRVTLAILDLEGRRVRTLADSELEAGDHRVPWNGLDDRGVRVNAGVYYARLSGPDGVSTRRMVFVR